ncbi:MAG: hypothetical protein M0Z82_02415 [Actinomycetota bacterium]|jgi:hypothetical protein|nr:hypothetical protein [Actinomycetota bacterium]
MLLRDPRDIVDTDGTLLGRAGSALGAWRVFCAGCNWVRAVAPGAALEALQAHRSEMLCRHGS